MEDKFLEIIETHKAIIAKISGSYTKNLEDRKDLFCEIVLQLWRSIKSFRGDSETSTWVYRVSLNTAMNHSRKIRSGIINYSNINEIEKLVCYKSTNEPAWIEELYECIGELDLLSRGLILLHLDGYSYAEIAQIMGISTSNVGTKLSRIKLRIKEIYTSK